MNCTNELKIDGSESSILDVSNNLLEAMLLEYTSNIVTEVLAGRQFW
jgi:hypothetical protein